MLLELQVLNHSFARLLLLECEEVTRVVRRFFQPRSRANAIGLRRSCNLAQFLRLKLLRFLVEL